MTIILISPFLYLGHSENYHVVKDIDSNNNASDLKLNQVSNFTVISNIHKLVWIEGYLDLTLTANESGIITCEFKDWFDPL